MSPVECGWVRFDGAVEQWSGVPMKRLALIEWLIEKKKGFRWEKTGKCGKRREIVETEIGNPTGQFFPHAGVERISLESFRARGLVKFAVTP